MPFSISHAFCSLVFTAMFAAGVVVVKWLATDEDSNTEEHPQ